MEIYVHIPFCVKKCSYCDFFSGPHTAEEQKRYFDELKEEIVLTPYGGGTVSSVFFGGGTPSIAAPQEIAAVLELLRKTFHLEADAEISMEANPGTLTAEKLYIYKQAGVNRLSLGLQSPDGGMLKKLGRIHDYETFLKSFEEVRAAGFQNVNIDLMSGLPGETAEGFEKGLKQVLTLKPEHLSVYSLIIEENTPFYVLYGENPDGTPAEKAGELPGEETDRLIYHRTGEILAENGYERYEISNYARQGFACRHNIGYWTGEEYLGFGAAAASYVDGKRFKNPAKMDYLSGPYEETEVLTEDVKRAEFMILGLRMARGVSEAEFERRFGRKMEDIYGDVIRKHEKYGTITRAEGRVFLTEYGLDAANIVMADFL